MCDFKKPWLGVAYVPCVTNLRALYAWVVRWQVTGMFSLAIHWLVGGRCPIMYVLTQSYPRDTWFVCNTLRELAVSNLGQILVCLSITWSRYRNAYRDLWIMTIVVTSSVRIYTQQTSLKPILNPCRVPKCIWKIDCGLHLQSAHMYIPIT